MVKLIGKTAHGLALLLLILNSVGNSKGGLFTDLEGDAKAILLEREYVTMEEKAWALSVSANCAQEFTEKYCTCTAAANFGSDRAKPALQGRLSDSYSFCKWSAIIWAYSHSGRSNDRQVLPGSTLIKFVRISCCASSAGC